MADGGSMDFSKIEEGHEDGEEPLVFHYNREERIKNAPELVKKYYDGELLQKRGLFRVLVATRANRMMLFVLVVCFILVGFIGFFGPKKSERTVQGVEFNLSAFSFDDSVYASIRCDEPVRKFLGDYEGKSIPIVAAVSFIDADSQVLFSETVSENYLGNQIFLRTSVTDYDIVKVCADFAFSGENVHLESSVEHR